MTDVIKRGPGRPRSYQVDAAPMKKGKASWKPASLNTFHNKEDGYRYRMMRKDPENLAKKTAEGWEVLSDLQGTKTAYDDPGRIDDGKPLTSVLEGRDWVMGRMPEEMAQARDGYMNDKAERQVAGLTAHIKKELGKDGAEMHGDITITSQRG